MNFSNSTTDKTERLKDTKSLTFQWETIDWKQVEYDVNRLQTRIAKATANGDNNKAKRIQYLLTHSFSAKAYAVRKVTTNKGKKYIRCRQEIMVNICVKDESSTFTHRQKL